MFVRGTLPRFGRLALWDPDGVPDAPAGAHSTVDNVELALRIGHAIRSRTLSVRMLDMPSALRWLAELSPGDASTPSVAAWAVAFRMGLDLVARGRLHPVATADGHDAWRVGPLDPADETRLAALTDWFPALAHAIRVPDPRVLRVVDPASLIRESWDAIADTMVRTPAASLTVSSPAWAAMQPTDVSGAGAWLDSLDGSEGDHARPGLRLELAPGGGEARAVVQLRSRVDPSLVVDADELWDAPAVVLARFGEQAETDLLLALRRGGRAWRPLARTLDDARPSVVDLDEDETAQLLGPAAESLAAAGFEVLWPAELTRSSLAAPCRGGDPGARERGRGRSEPRRAVRVPLAGHGRRRIAHRSRARRAGGGETSVDPGARAVGRRRPAAPRSVATANRSRARRRRTRGRARGNPDRRR